MGKFGYINEGNPLFIGDNESMEMVNCRIDGGYLEYGDFSLSNYVYDNVPNRRVSLPNSQTLVIDAAQKVPPESSNSSDYWACRGKIMRLITSGTEWSDGDLCSGTLTTTAGQKSYVFQLKNENRSGRPDVFFDPDSFVFQHVYFNGTPMSQALFTWRAGASGTPDYGKVIVELVNDPGAGQVLAVTFIARSSDSGMIKCVAPAPTSAIFSSVTIEQPVRYILSGGDFDLCSGTLTTTAGQRSYVFQLKDVDVSGMPDISFDINSFFFQYVYLNGTPMSETMFTWRAGAQGTSDYGKVIIELVNDPGNGQVLAVTFKHYLHPEKVFTKPGKYFYAFTYYDLVGGLESPPFYKSIEITDNHIQTLGKELFIKFSGVHIESSVYADFPSTRLRMYRIPFGADEYLFDREFTSTSPVDYIDSVPDTELGEALTTAGNTYVPFENTDVIAIRWHRERLFVAISQRGAKGLLYFSKAGMWNEFPAANFFVFKDEIVALTQHNENLVILTKEEIFVLYGNDEDGFQLNKVDYIPFELDHRDWKQTFSINSAQSISGYMIALAKTSNKKTDQIILFNSQSAINISTPIRKTIATEGYASPIDNYNPLNAANKNRVLENRFYVYERFKDKDGNKDNIVYDVLARGFCKYDPSLKYSEDDEDLCFVYSTKQYSVNASYSGVDFRKTFFVRGVGVFKVEVHGDYDIITTVEFDLLRLQTVFFHVKSYRTTVFSLRFIGKIGAEIHDWGISDGDSN